MSSSLPDCNWHILSAMRRIDDLKNQTMVTRELLDLKEYLTGHYQMLASLSVQAIEVIIRVFTSILRPTRDISIQFVCLEILSTILRSSCHGLLKNRLMLVLEPELCTLYATTDYKLRVAVWKCFYTHAERTNNVGPILRLFLTDILDNLPRQKKLDELSHSFTQLIQNFPNSELNSSDSGIIIMLLLETGHKNNRDDAIVFCMNGLDLIRSYIGEHQFISAIQNLPNHLQQFYLEAMEQSQYRLTGPRHFMRPMMNQMNRQEDMGWRPPMPTTQKYPNLPMIGSRFGERNSHDSGLFPLRTRRWAPLEGYSDYRMDNNMNLGGMATGMKPYNDFNQAILPPSRSYDSFSSSDQNLPTFLRYFSQIVREEAQEGTLCHLLETLHVLFRHMQPSGVNKHTHLILNTISGLFSNDSRDVQRLLRNLLVDLVRIGPAELICDQLLSLIRRPSPLRTRVQLIRALIVVMLRCPHVELDTTTLAHDLVRGLTDSHVEIRSATVELCAVFLNALDQQDLSYAPSKVNPLLRSITDEMKGHSSMATIQALMVAINRSRQLGCSWLSEDGEELRIPADMRELEQEIILEEKNLKTRVRGEIVAPKRSKFHQSPIGVAEDDDETTALPNSYSSLHSKNQGAYRQFQASRRKALMEKKQNMEEADEFFRRTPPLNASDLEQKYSYPKHKSFKPHLSEKPKEAKSLNNIHDSVRLRRHQLHAENLTQPNPDDLRLERSINSALSRDGRQVLRPSNLRSDNPQPEPYSHLIDHGGGEKRKHLANLRSSGNFRQQQCRIAKTNPKLALERRVARIEKKSPKRRHVTVDPVPQLSPRQEHRTQRSPIKSPQPIKPINRKIKALNEPTDEAIRLLNSTKWEEQLRGLESFDKLFQEQRHQELDRVIEDNLLFQNTTRGLIKAIRNLRSQVCRTAMQSVLSLGNYLLATERGCLWDNESDDLVAALLARAGGDTSTKFLLVESLDCLSVVVFCLSWIRAIHVMCRQLLERKTKSSHGRHAVGTLLAHLVESDSERPVTTDSPISKKLGPDEAGRLVRASAMLANDGASENRLCGQRIFLIILQDGKMEGLCKKILSDQQWRSLQKICNITTSR